MANTNGIEITTKRTAVTFGALKVNEYQKPGTKTAEVRQEIITDSYYPSKKTTSDLNGGLFDTSDFGFEKKHFQNTDRRVAWILVPANATEEMIKQKLEAAVKAGAVIYKVLSNSPILDENQKYAIEAGQRTMNDFANSQVVRYPDNHAKAGQLCLDKNGKVQYRRTFFWGSAMSDVDKRTAEKDDVYMSPEIAAELSGASVLEGQTIL